MEKLKEKSDQELVGLFKETKNDACFEELFSRYKNKVYSRCLNFVGNNEDAQDLTQEIFVKTYFNLKKFKGESSFSTWLFRITSNHCYNFVTRKKPVGISLEREEIEKHVGIRDKDRSIKIDVQKALLKLSPEDRIVLVMKYIDGYQYKEIAKILNIKESAAKMRVKRAKEKFKKVYEK